MKQREQIIAELVNEWLEKASQDLGVAGFLLAEGTSFFSAIGFHAQQAVEKYLKGFLVRHQVEFRKTHDLAVLLDLVASVDENLAYTLSNVTALNPFGVEARYPGDMPLVTRDEALEAVSLVRKTEGAIKAVLKAFLERQSV